MQVKQKSHASTVANPPATENKTVAIDANSPAIPFIAEALGQLAAKAFEAAEWKIEEAIQVDPQYGPAYYWLARVKYEQDNPSQALMFLKRAEKLLSGSDIWQPRLEELRQKIQSKS